MGRAIADPRRVRRAPGPGPRLRPQHDGGVGRRARRSPWPRFATSSPGEIVFLGTPAEERGSGKQFMIDDGLFAGVDAALLFHPGDRDMVGCLLLASEDVEVTFSGKAAHAAGEPWEGRNALDAIVLLFSAVGLWRQQLPPHARVHGIVLEGGTAANIIPDRTTAWFMIRSTDQADYRVMRDRFAALVAGAAADGRRCTGEVGLLRRLHDDEATTTSWAVAGARTWRRPDGVRRGRRPGAHRQLRHGQRLPGPADDPPGPGDLRPTAFPGTPSNSATRPPRPGRTRPRSSPPRSSRRRPSTCSPIPRSSRPPGAEFRGERVGLARTLAARYHRPARPAGRRTRTGGARTGDDASATAGGRARSVARPPGGLA